MKKLFLLILAVAFSVSAVTAQQSAKNRSTAKLSGTVYERSSQEQNDSIPLEFALISLPDYGMSASTTASGYYEFKGIPAGKTRVKITFVGKLPFESTVVVDGNTEKDFTLENENFRIKEITVTARASQAGQSTSSVIGRSAMDHMQATSLKDVLALLPGNMTMEPNLSAASSATIRGTSSMNALGTAIIRDGAPISNNANMSTTASGLGGTATTVAGGANPQSGIDMRSISTDNIESVEVIRGIPSVEYGDLTSGAIIVNSKAGREPIRVNVKANPKLYMGSIGTGFSLGENKGAMNVSADYAHNTNDPVASYDTYQRLSARAMYSKEFGRNLRSNTSFNFYYGKDGRSLNPDDKDYMREKRAEEYNFSLNTNGTWNINKGWLKSLRYVASGTYAKKSSFNQVLSVSNYNPYSGTVTDGVVVSNRPGEDVYDADGNKITNFGDADRDKFAYIIPNNYLSRFNNDSREVNVFAKVVATLFKQTGPVNNRILIGADFRTDGNVGHGSTWDPTMPPERQVNLPNGSFRPRDYSKLPFINQVGVYAEENFSWQMGLHELRLQAGVRYDHVNRAGGKVSPRFNASFEVLPSKLWIRGGYGITAKMPTMFYLYPEDIYYEYKNIDETTSSKIPDDQKLVLTTTKIYDPSNRDLKIATNHKAEVGFDLKLGQMTFSVTGYYERLKNGYGLTKDLDTFRPFEWTEYKRDANNELVVKSTNTVLSSWFKPDNTIQRKNKGVEFDLNFGRIEAINTSISLLGAYTKYKYWTTGYSFYAPNDDKVANKRTDIAIYDRKGDTSTDENLSTALRITHNIPRIGFVVTLTAETVWKDANWGTYGNDSIPVGFVSIKDGSSHFFEDGKYTSPDQLREEGLDYLLRTPGRHPLLTKESYKPYFCFNINVTKEIGDMMRVSFFANNMFRSYPRRESRRDKGSYTLLNNRFYFGVELALKF